MQQRNGVLILKRVSKKDILSVICSLGMVNGYVAKPADDSLESYLVEALYLLEMRFKLFDADGAGFVARIMVELLGI